MGKKLIGIAVIAIMLFGIFGLTACGSTQGIPHGTYHSCNEDGVVTKGAPETAWQIKDGEAEYLYTKYMISEVDGKVYFEYEAHKFEVKFDKDTKIMTVFMPSSLASDNGEIKAFYFKK